MLIFLHFLLCYDTVFFELSSSFWFTLRCFAKAFKIKFSRSWDLASILELILSDPLRVAGGFRLDDKSEQSVRQVNR